VYAIYREQVARSDRLWNLAVKGDLPGRRVRQPATARTLAGTEAQQSATISKPNLNEKGDAAGAALMLWDGN